jgi:hypothetical protein
MQLTSSSLDLFQASCKRHIINRIKLTITQLDRIAVTYFVATWMSGSFVVVQATRSKVNKQACLYIIIKFWLAED